VTADGVATAATGPREPLTERILATLGEPQWLWILVWTGVSLIRPVVLSFAVNASGRQLSQTEWLAILSSQIAIGWVTLVGFLGVRRISRGARALAPELASLAGTETGPGAQSFRGMSSTVGPLALAAAIVVVPSFASTFQHWGTGAALGDLPLVIVNALPSMTFVWTYLVLLASLDRLGRARLSLDPFPEDRSLGLGAVGSLALTGFWLVLAAAVPLAIVGQADVPTVALSVGVIVATVAVFFLSMFRVHRQMAAAKERYVAIARALYREAYEPVRTKPSLKALQAQAPALDVAQALVERAEDVQEWPIDERATAWVAVVITGVVTSLLVRLVLTAAGL
jgi:hypothetical protein